MILGTGIFLISSAPLSFSTYSLVLEHGVFEIASTPIAMTVSSTMVLETGIFTIGSSNMGIYDPCAHSGVLDELAAEAPYPPADFFIPVTDLAPTVVLSPDEAFGPTSTDPDKNIYDGYYDRTTQTWNDNAYQTQYPGLFIPLDLKERVASQVYLYDQYAVALALWQADYDRQKLFQWPYYWAQNVARAYGSVPGGTEKCGCECVISLLPNIITPANQDVVGGSPISMDDLFDIGGTKYTAGQILAMVLKKLAEP